MVGNLWSIQAEGSFQKDILLGRLAWHSALSCVGS